MRCLTRLDIEPIRDRREGLAARPPSTDLSDRVRRHDQRTTQTDAFFGKACRKADE